MLFDLVPDSGYLDAAEQLEDNKTLQEFLEEAKQELADAQEESEADILRLATLEAQLQASKQQATEMAGLYLCLAIV